MGKTSSFTGPLVSSAIITASGGNGNMPFAIFSACGYLDNIQIATD